MMVEGEMLEVSEAEMLEAIKLAHEAIKKQCAAQKILAQKAGRILPVREYAKKEDIPELEQKVQELAYQKVYDIAKLGLDKKERSERFGELKEEVFAAFSEEELEEHTELIGRYFSKIHKKAIRDLILNEGIRLDGRKTDEIRPIWCEVSPLPSTHGSAIFTRGETQVLSTTTLGTSRDVNIIDIPPLKEKRISTCIIIFPLSLPAKNAPSEGHHDVK
jgi:polyribonucleotide nucleotidyltransferase